MKYTILIADDEYFIRQRMKKIIPFEILNLRFIGEAENGQEVIDYLEKYTIDIILLDIKMPKITGIDVAKFVYEHFTLTKIIILSGYNDFEYARQTLRYGVFDYLLKPVESLLLETTLKNCTQKIEEEREREHQIAAFKHYKKCDALSNILNQSQPIENLYEDYPEFFFMKYSLYIGVYIYDQSEQFIKRLAIKLMNSGIICEYFKEYEYTYIIQVFAKDLRDLELLTPVLNSFIEDCNSYTFIVEGTPFKFSNSWNTHYKSVLKLLNHRYFSENSYTNQVDLQYENIDFSKSISQLRQNLLFSLNNKNTSALTECIDNLFESIISNKNADFLQLVVTECLMTCQIYYGNLLELANSISDLVTIIIDEDYQLLALKSTILNYCFSCIQKTDATPSDVSFSNKLTSYILEHYSEPELSVNKLAEIFSLNPSYMGSIFKKVNNISILQYITNIRMEKSKELLLNATLKISDIAELVGYSDVFYYSKRFKKIYGYSPKEHNLKSNKGVQI